MKTMTKSILAGAVALAAFFILAGGASERPSRAYGAELVRFAEDNASSELWPLLKRADEKWVTEHAYENPKFVEDLVRDVALAIDRDPRVGRYSIDVENFESIHNHSAYARIERV